MNEKSKKFTNDGGKFEGKSSSKQELSAVGISELSGAGISTMILPSSVTTVSWLEATGFKESEAVFLKHQLARQCAEIKESESD